MSKSKISSFFSSAPSKRRRVEQDDHEPPITAPVVVPAAPSISSPQRPTVEVITIPSPPRGSRDSADPVREPRPCTRDCCDTSNHEPTRLKFDKSDTGRQQGKRTRYFQPEWLNLHSWLVLCTSRHLAFCQTCRFALEAGIVKMSGHSFEKGNHSTFAKSGFNDWKDGSASLKSHEQSLFHKTCEQQIVLYLRSPSVEEILDKATVVSCFIIPMLICKFESLLCMNHYSITIIILKLSNFHCTFLFSIRTILIMVIAGNSR